MSAVPGVQQFRGLGTPSPNHMDAGSWGSTAYAGSNSNGPRQAQEDRWVAVPRLLEPPAPNVLLVAVFDGHGGPSVAERCERAVKEVAIRALQEQGAIKQQHLTHNQLQSALERAFSRLSALCPDRGVGTTVTLLLVTDSLIGVGHVGDSRAVLLDGGRAPLVLTLDHKGSNEEEAARVLDLGGCLDREGYVQGSLGVSRALGDRELHPFVSDKPEVTVLPRNPSQQALVVASDGLWDVISLETAARLAETGLQYLPEDEHSIAPAVRASDALMQAALAAGTQDNITVAVVDLRLGSVPPCKAAVEAFEAAAATQDAAAGPAAAAGGAQKGDALTMSYMRQVQRQEQDQDALAAQRLSRWLNDAAAHPGTP